MQAVGVSKKTVLGAYRDYTYEIEEACPNDGPAIDTLALQCPGGMQLPPLTHPKFRIPSWTTACKFVIL